MVTKYTIYLNTKTQAFSAEFNFVIRKILINGNGIPISIGCLKFLTYEIYDKQIRIFKGGGRCLEKDPIWHSLSSCRQNRTLSGIRLVSVDRTGPYLAFV